MPFSSARTRAIGLLCLFSPALLHAEERCAGSPFVNVTRPRAIEESAEAIVGPQIFDIAPHPRGFVLMANNNGLLTYDGGAWRLMPLGRSAVALSVSVAADGRIFAGGSRTFGEVVEDPTGELMYQPLETRVSPEDHDFSDVWQTLVSAEGVVYFRSREKIFILRNGELRALSPKGGFSAAGLAGNVLYVHDSGAGVLSIEGGQPLAVPGGERFKGVLATSIAEGPEGSVFVGTQDRGLFRLDPKRGEVRQVGSAAKALAGSEILSVRMLSDGQIAVGTLRNGLIVLDASGQPRFRMDRDSGLPDNAVLTLQASQGSLWAGTSGGVAQLLMPNPIENYGAREGLPGLVESLVEHGGTIYAASSQGVFRFTCRERGFEAIPSLRKQAFALLSAGTLLAATTDGIYEIDGASTRLVRAGLARGLSKSNDEGRIWAATQAGVVALRRAAGRWIVDSPLSATGPEFERLTDVEATSVGEDGGERLWIALVTGRLLAGLPVRRGASLELTEIRTFGEEQGIAPGFAEVISLKDGIRIGTATAVLRPQGFVLVPDPAFTEVLGAGGGAFRIRNARDGGYWVASAKRPLRLVTEGLAGALTVRRTSLLRIPAGSRILDFLDISDTEAWIGTDDGAFRYDPSREARDKNPATARVRRVRSNETVLFSGGPSDSLETPLPHLAPLRFEVASTSLDDPSRNRFRFRLDGQDTDWSPWTQETRKDYTNLGPGAYRFRVETRDVYGRVGDEAGFSFVVLKPWYREPWAISLGLGILGGLFYGALYLRTRALRNRQRELETIVDQKTAELREASFTDPLTGLRNRRYFAEIIEAEASLACRPGSAALHMFLVDLDHFKQVNDTYGHAAGDDVLRQTAARLRAATRASDLIFRWGGEEFLIVARGAPDLPRTEIADRIERMMGKEPFDIGAGKKLPRTCSVGFATFPFYVDNPTSVPLDAVLELADLALYRAKQTGRNRAVGVSPQAGAPAPGDIWKNSLLENLEKAAVSVEVVEGPPVQES